ncbi:MAG: serine protease [Sandaracinaceae bacterium]|nr:serine protease [Sandaracinaceae bacterium]
MSDRHEPVSNEETDIGGRASRAGDGAAAEGSPLGLEPVPGFDESVLRAEPELAMAEPTTDAWLATIPPGTPMPEVVIGEDERKHIDPPAAFPWRAVCSLRIQAKDGQSFIGTAWLIAPRVLITAGHCVYMHAHGGWARSIDVSPARNGDSRPHGTVTATAFRSTRGWTEGRDREHDYGAILLPAGQAFAALGAFGYASLRDDQLRGKWVNVSGYPGDKPSGTQWWGAKKIRDLSARLITYEIDTAGGQSGSPIWRTQGTQRIAVGIHTNGDFMGNSGTRIDDTVYANLERWRREGE